MTGPLRLSVVLPLPESRGGSGLDKPLTLIERPVRDRIPIHLAALGARSVEPAAEIAEGWIPFVYVPELADRVWAEPPARGRKRMTNQGRRTRPSLRHNILLRDRGTAMTS
jgi:alkanesulfonate monooxygenase SsuD/methylene tetrahydromethanopterin reductase-like flavin-dependent oxidoreductase (luciferase family)